HISLAWNGLALVRRVALDLGARAFDAQVFGRQQEALAALEAHRKRLAVLGKADLGRPIAHGGFRGGGVAASGRFSAGRMAYSMAIPKGSRGASRLPGPRRQGWI